MQSVNVTLGADPELFFRDKEGRLLPSEAVVPPEGAQLHGAPARTYDSSTLIRDGVQGEINFGGPNGAKYTCRESFSLMVQAMMAGLGTTCTNKGIVPDFSVSVVIPPKQFTSMSEATKQFGCKPSCNTNLRYEMQVKKVDPQKYRRRSAGGHIHLGFANSYTGDMKYSDEQIVRVVNCLDVLLANTCVLLDRDEGNAKRRKLYGLAGEYRRPPYGLEYRTLSNFWLRSYQLTSFVMAMARNCVSLGHNSNKTMADELLSSVDMELVHRAINTNDFDMAMHTYNNIKPWLAKHGFEPLPAYRHEFMDFMIEKGLDFFFSKDYIKNWGNIGPDGANYGYYRYDGGKDAYGISLMSKGWESFADHYTLTPAFKEWQEQKQKKAA